MRVQVARKQHSAREGGEKAEPVTRIHDPIVVGRIILGQENGIYQMESSSTNTVSLKRFSMSFFADRFGVVSSDPCMTRNSPASGPTFSHSG